MQRTIWEWLGIEKTRDKSRIKKAYAERAKKYHPEEFPEEAQELRKAYKDAMAQASDTRAVSNWDQVYAEQGYAYADPATYGTQPEPDSGSEPKYAYRSPKTPGTQPDSDSESEPKYAYRSPKQPGTQSEPDSEAEPKYAYRSPKTPGTQPESDSESESKYTYRRPKPLGTQPEAESESEQRYAYTRSKPSGTQPKTDAEAEPEYRFYSPKLPPERMKRIADLKERMETIYGSKYRNFVKDWQRAFAACLEPEDLKDLQAVWEIFRVIEPMQRLRGATWEVIQEELFRFRENTAPWQLLQERFDQVRRPYVAPKKTAAGISADSPTDTSTDTSAEPSAEPPGSRWFEDSEETPVVTPPKRASLWDTFVATLIVFLVIILFGIMDKVQERERQQEIQEQLREQITQQVLVETPPLPVSKEIFQITFTKESPWELDLNGDEMPDHLYYDPDKGLFMVELYDISTETYDSYGSLNQYLEENPETENMKILSYLAGGESSK